MFTLNCKTCGLELAKAAKVMHLEIECRRCHKTTAFSTAGPDDKNLNLITNRVYRDRKRPDSTAYTMKTNRYVDARKC